MSATMRLPRDIISEPVPDLQYKSRAQVEAYLADVARALLEVWGDQLEELCDSSRYARDKDAEDRVKELCADINATENFGGIMKSAVLVNHQWVVKLGHNAIDEMQIYADNEDNDYQDQMVPTVWLGDLGCVALKVELPMMHGSGDYIYEDDQHEEWYQDFKCDSGVPDCHRGNVGIWRGRMVAIDWGGGA